MIQATKKKKCYTLYVKLCDITFARFQQVQFCDLQWMVFICWFLHFNPDSDIGETLVLFTSIMMLFSNCAFNGGRVIEMASGLEGTNPCEWHTCFWKLANQMFGMNFIIG